MTRTQRIARNWYVWLGIAVVLFGVALGAIFVEENTELVPDSLAWATFMLTFLAATATGSFGVALGLLRLRVRYHTRSA